MKNILIIDDDHEVTTSLAALLEKAGYRSCWVSSSKEAIEKITSEHFDLVLLDIIMPRISGLDILADIRRLSPMTQVIMMTGFPSVEDAIYAVKKGACDYITKPFNHEDLFSKIDHTLERARIDDCVKNFDLNLIFDSFANPTRRSILRLFSPKLNIRLSDISKELNIEDQPKVIFHLKILKEGRIIEQDKNKSYVLTPEGEKVLDCLKIIENYLSKK